MIDRREWLSQSSPRPPSYGQAKPPPGATKGILTE